MKRYEIPGFGERLRQAREAAGMSQADVGVAIGTTRQGVHAYEVGHTLPSLAIAKRMAACLKVSLDWLAGHEVKRATTRRKEG